MKDTGPHISLLWGPGDIKYNLSQEMLQIGRSRNGAGLSQRHNFKC
jgi:hypothetical protein